MAQPQPKVFSIKKLFLNQKYIIPIYQRPYAWGDKEIEQLLNDIYDVKKLSKNQHYYLGTLVTNKSKKGFYVIDGQQRLTTLYLLFIILGNDLIKFDSLAFEARNESNKILKKLLAGGLRGAATEHSLIKDNGNNNNDYSNKKNKENSIIKIAGGLRGAATEHPLIKGYNIIKNYFNGKSDLIEFFKDAINKVMIIQVQVPQKIDLNHYFEVINTRGEQLTCDQIIKAKILNVLNKESAYCAKIASDIWDSCANMNSYIQMHVKKDTRKIIFGNDWDKFAINNINNFDDICKLGYNVSDANSDEDEDDETYTSIITFVQFLLQVSSVLKTKNIDEESSLDDKKISESLSWVYKNTASAKLFIFSLLKYRFLFDNYIIKRKDDDATGDSNNWSLKRLTAYKNKNGTLSPNYSKSFYGESNEDIKVLQEALRITYTSPASMHWIHKTLESLGHDNFMIKDFLEKYCRNKIKEVDYKNLKGFDIPHIVFTYLDYILYRDNKNEYKDFYFRYRKSIEHFYPQNPISNKKWDSDDLNDFGNLALLTVSGNSIFSNAPPESKIGYHSIVAQSPKLQIMANIAENGWDKDRAKLHGKEMIELLNKELKL